METSASDFVLEVVLSQKEEGRKLHLVAFYSKKNSTAEINYKIHEKLLWILFKNGATCLKVLHIR
jgi:hypothetical protein